MTWQDVRDLAYHFDDLVMLNKSYLPSTNHRPSRDNNREDPMELGTTTTNTERRPATPYRRPPTRSSSPSASRSSSPAPKALPKLTERMREELRRNNGCFRCQKPNAGHIARNCPGPRAATAARVTPTSSSKN
jgi:hypothetical protein